MNTPTLKIKNVAQINEASIEFGDLTVFVGPQATGKSITLQLLKLMVDARAVQTEMKRYGLDWDNHLPDFLDAYLGEGMRSIWDAQKSSIEWNGNLIDLPGLVNPKTRRTNKEKDESLFYIPAQRVLTLQDGWPRPFTAYKPGDPFAVREFSEKLRNLVEAEFNDEKLFPQSRRLKEEFRDMLQRDMFGGFDLKINKHHSQKRLVLGQSSATDGLPYMVWSAGQREFTPLLLGLYWLLPPAKPRRKNIEWVVIEEIEMGLHPKAIATLMLMIFDLVTRGYRVCLSTHSSQVLDALWMLKLLREHKAASRNLLKAFDVEKTPSTYKLAEGVLKKTSRVYCFDRAPGGIVRDISALDPALEESGEAGWGGLSEFSVRVSETVAMAVANSNQPAQSLP